MSVALEEITIGSEPRLAAFTATSKDANTASRREAVVLCHGVPSKQRPGVPNRTYQSLAKRLASTLGWAVLAVSLRGCGDSEGNFSLSGWVTDIASSVDHLRSKGIEHIWLVGSTTGGSLALMAAAADPQLEGVAAMAPRADFDDWASESRRFIEHCRELGIISDPTFPASAADWTRELRQNRPLVAAAELGERPLLIIHGTEDRQVPPDDAQRLASRHPNTTLRLIPGADHRIRHDPRAIAILQGWLLSSSTSAASIQSV